jgi:hypothetical protein
MARHQVSSGYSYITDSDYDQTFIGHRHDLLYWRYCRPRSMGNNKRI